MWVVELRAPILGLPAPYHVGRIALVPHDRGLGRHIEFRAGDAIACP
jgi:hypothetical protein